MLQDLLAKTPADLKARNLLGIALLNSGRREEAAVQFRQALQTDPNFQPALKNLALDEIALGQQAAAVQHFEKLLALSPHDPVAHFYLGESCFRAGRFAQAIEHYQQSEGLHLQTPETMMHAAKSAIEAKRGAVAAEVFSHLPADAADLQFEAGTLLAGANLYDASARHFLLAQNGYRDPYAAGFNLVLVYIDGGNYAAAIEAGEPLARRFPKAELYNLLSRAYEAGGRTRDAYDALRAATKIDPRDESNYLDLMSLCVAHENWDLSLEIAAIALENLPHSYRVRILRGAVFGMKGQLPEAESEFSAAARQAPQDSVPGIALAVVRLERKQPEQAVEVLRRDRADHPHDYRVCWFLGEALHQMGAEKEAMEALEESIRWNPAAVPARLLLGKILAARGDQPGARRQFEEALKLDPDNAGAAYQLALIYRKAGNMARAQELMSKAGKAASVSNEPTVTTRDLVKIIRADK